MTTRALFTLGAILLLCPIASAGSPPAPHLKSRDRATLTALGATLLPIGVGALLIAVDLNDDDGSSAGSVVGTLLVGSGVLFGPSFGRVYAHDRKPLSLVPLRLAGLGVGLLGLSLFTLNEVSESGASTAQVAIGLVAFGAGTAGYVVGTVKDFVRAPKAVDKYNEHLTGAAWHLRPVYYSASHAVGANFTLRF